MGEGGCRCGGAVDPIEPWPWPVEKADGPVFLPKPCRIAPKQIESVVGPSLAFLALASRKPQLSEVACHAEGRRFESDQPLFRECPACGRVGLGRGAQNQLEPSPQIAVISGTNAH